MKARQWFRMEGAASDPSVAEIYITDFIGDWIDDYWGFGVTAKSFIDQLSKLSTDVKAIRVHINSPGGDVFSAVTIANALRDQQATKGRTVDTVVDGIAASAASIIMMAGGKVQIADNGIVMIHNPMTIAAGNAAEMRKAADTLDTLRNTIVATYQWHSELEADAIIALMDAESWMDADQAIANGFATDKIEGLKAVAALDQRAVAKLTIPDKFKARVEALVKPADPVPIAAAPADVLARVSAAGLDLAFASSLVAAALPLDQVTARIETAKAEKTKADARGAAIRALGVTAKQVALAETFIAGGLTVDAAKAALTDVTAQLDKITIDGALPPDTGRPTVRIDPAAVYAARNK